MSDDEESTRERKLLYNVETSPTTTPADPCGFYAALGLPSTATAQDIRQAFLTLSQAYHTDKHAKQDAETQRLMNTRFQQIQEAYQILSDERRRVAYDHSGSIGVERLDLIPSTIHTREDILRVLDTLSREAEVRSTAKMLGSSGSITLTYSIAHWWQPARRRQRRKRQATPSPPPTVPQDMQSGSAQQQPTTVNPEVKPLVTQEEQAPAVTPTQTNAKPEPEAPPPPPPEGNASSQEGIPAKVTLKEVIIDGKSTVVAILPDQLQGQLRAALQKQGAAPAAGSEGIQQQNKAQSFANSPFGKLFLSAFPRTLQFRHGFTHMVAPFLNLQFRAEAMQKANEAKVAFAVQCDYTPNGVSAWGTTWKAAINSLRWVVYHKRALNKLWQLKNRLTLLDGAEVLGQYRLTLERKLSDAAQLATTICWGLAGGYFETNISRAIGDSSLVQMAQIRLGYQDLTCVLFQAKVFGSSRDDVVTTGKKKIQQHISFNAFTGMTSVSYQFWWFKNRLQHFGIGFTAIVPYSLSPVHPPFFVSMSTDYTTMCQISLLYERGDHSISIPIIITASKVVWQAAMLLTVPWTAYRVAGLLWRPIRRFQSAQTAKKSRRQIQTQVIAAREDALREQSAIDAAVHRRRALEEKVVGGGLIIINAQYGVLKPEIPVLDAPYPLDIDVTIPLQNFVSNSKLLLPEGPKRNMIGFYDVDPATDEKRFIKITYWFKKSRHSVTVAEEDAIELPQNEHLEKS